MTHSATPFRTRVNTANEFQYDVQQLDEPAGDYYLRARYYSETDGRFLSTDPEVGNGGDPTSLHRYLYAGNDPVQMDDNNGREGLHARLWCVLVIAIILVAGCGVNHHTASTLAIVHTIGRGNRPSSTTFWGAYSKIDDDVFPGDPGRPGVWAMIGGSVGSYLAANVDNTCASGVSYGLNYGGAPIPKGTEGANFNYPSVEYQGKPGDKQYYIISAQKMHHYLRRSWGRPEYSNISSDGDVQAIEASLKPQQCAIFATNVGYGHTGVSHLGYQDPNVFREAKQNKIDVWLLPNR